MPNRTFIETYRCASTEHPELGFIDIRAYDDYSSASMTMPTQDFENGGELDILDYLAEHYDLDTNDGEIICELLESIYNGKSKLYINNTEYEKDKYMPILEEHFGEE